MNKTADIKKYRRDYYKLHKEKLDKQTNDWRRKNKELVRQYQKRYAEANKEKIKEVRKNWKLKNPQKYSEMIERGRERKRELDIEYARIKRATHPGYKTAEYRKYRERFPEKVRAQQLLNIAIKKQKIKKSPTCEVCGKETKLHGHHPDYSEPYKVKWLCTVCHIAEHKRIL